MKKPTGNCQNIRIRHWDSTFTNESSSASIIFHKMTWLNADQSFSLNWDSGNECCLLVYTIQGKGRIHYNDQTCSMEPNQVILLNIAPGYQVQSLSNDWKLVWMLFSGMLAERLVFEIHKYKGLVFPAATSTKELLDDIYHLTCTPADNHLSDIRVSSKIYTLLADLMTESPATIRTTPAISYIQNHYGENISVDMLANVCHMSKYYFVRIFHTENGVSPIEFLQQYRITIARHLLLETQKSIALIAEETGFENQSYFSKIFRKYCGVSPRQYRSENFLHQ